MTINSKANIDVQFFFIRSSFSRSTLLPHDYNTLAPADGEVIRAYEDAATATGRLDATGRLASAGLRELLVLRCIAHGIMSPGVAPHSRMIALLLANGEGRVSARDPIREYGRELRAAAARARGGAVPSVASLHQSLGLSQPAWDAQTIDDLLRDAGRRTPPLLKAALASIALRDAAGDATDDAAKGATEPLHSARLAALAVTLVLCVGGATTDAWLTLPDGPGPLASLRDTFVALAREARAAERGILAARERIDTDERRVRESLGRAAYSALDVLALLSERLVITVPDAARDLGLTPPTAGAAVARLEQLGIAREVTGKARSREFAYESIIKELAPESASAP